MKRKPQPTAAKSYQVYPVDTPVKIMRPHIWSGYFGKVVKASEDGVHLVLVSGKVGDPDSKVSFRATVSGDQLGAML